MMCSFQPFDPLRAPLEGNLLIEAGAGTGKTYAIEALFLRLLLEKNLPIDKILVVTYTVAATEDLKRRLREKIRAALRAWDTGHSSDAFLDPWLKKTISATDAAKTLLEDALHGFDEAAIHTIHGFCRRVLAEYAFESQAGFDFQVVTEHREWLREAVDNVWRRSLFHASPLFLQYLQQQRETPEKMVSWLAEIIYQPIRIIPEEWLQGPFMDLQDHSREEQDFRDSFSHAATVWVKSRKEILDFLHNHAGLNRTVYRKESIPSLGKEMEKYFRSTIPLALPACYDKFWDVKMNKGKDPPSYPLFQACRQLREAHNRLTGFFSRLRWNLYGEIQRQVSGFLDERKNRLNIKCYEDLLADVARALKGLTGERLAGQLRLRFPAALVDEFQDTNPLQYQILQTIYGKGGGSLFLIGDPKQAIYGFRGADIFSYLEASRDASARYTLDTNWRSVPRLVQGLNTLFQFRRDRACFVFPEIRLHPVRPTEWGPEEQRLGDGSYDDSPLVLWFIPRDANQKCINRTESVERIAHLLSEEIVRLLQAGQAGQMKIDDRPVGAADIAILVRTHSQALEVLEILRQRGIPAVCHSQGSVFQSVEAEELMRILEAMAAPTQEAKVKAALGTNLCYIGGDDLLEMIADDHRWEARINSFSVGKEAWIHQGIMPMMRRFIEREEVRSRLLSAPDGERRLTNLWHLVELLHEAEHREGLGLEGLIQWLDHARRESPEDRNETYAMRLETDEKAVKLITIHSSKGLEYPIVFCPFMWYAPMERRNDCGPVQFHDPLHSTQRIRDIGSPEMEQNRLRAYKEKLAEDARLLYVAVTRARYRCYLLWGAFNGAEKSALGYVLHPRHISAYPPPSEILESLTDQALLADMQELAEDSQGSIRVVERKQAGTSEFTSNLLHSADSFSARKFQGRIADNWGIASFTSLTSMRDRPDDGEDRGEALIHQSETTRHLPAESPIEYTIYHFPRGPKAGQMLHQVMQEVRFSDLDLGTAQSRIRDLLAQYRFDNRWAEEVEEMVRRVFTLSLDRIAPGFALAMVSPRAWLTEMEFSLPLQVIRPEDLAGCFPSAFALPGSLDYAEWVGRLGFRPIRGRLKGFVDLVFCWQDRYYLIDWKSNDLGKSYDSYRTEALQRVITEEYYFLQYYLYVVALHRYLQQVLPGYQYERHFGGVAYFFLRGIHPQKGPGYGLYWDRPPCRAVMKLNHCLGGE